jgi:hypothetical protein
VLLLDTGYLYVFEIDVGKSDNDGDYDTCCCVDYGWLKKVKQPLELTNSIFNHLRTSEGAQRVMNDRFFLSVSTMKRYQCKLTMEDGQFPKVYGWLYDLMVKSEMIIIASSSSRDGLVDCVKFVVTFA